MSLSVVAARIEEIRTTIAQLDPRTAAASSSAAASSTTAADPAGSPLSAAAASGDFAALLTAATQTRSASGAAAQASTGASRATATGGLADPVPVPASGATASDFVAAARRYLGVPYVWGGESLSEGGLDCSGLVQLALKDVGVDVPRTARQQMTVGAEVPSLAQAVPGDLIVTRGGGHIMIYLGDNRVLHAPRPGQDVQIREMFESDADITTIRRVLPTDTGQPAGQDLATAAARAALTGAGA